MGIPGIEQIDSGAGKIDISGDEISGGSSGGDCSREKVMNVILLVMVFILLGLFAFLFFTDRLVVGIQNPFSKQEENVDIPSEYCFYNGIQYTNGEGFPSDDGCNTCSCTEGEVVCTLMACEGSCVPTEDQCKGAVDGSSCLMEVWCDENGMACGVGECTNSIPGSCENEVCEYLPD